MHAVLFKKFFLLLLLGLSFFCFETKAQADHSDQLVFSTHWLPQAQFAGYYMADKMGFYREAGLDLRIIHPPANLNAIEYLENGSADIVSMFLVSAMEACMEGKDLVNIAQMSEHSAIVFVSKKENQINDLSDLQGKKVGIWKSGFEEVPKAFLKENQVVVTWVPILSSVNLFLMGGIDLMTVMWYNEYNQIYLSGIDEEELNTFFMKDYGFDIPEDGLYVNRASLDSKREELAEFVDASLKGWAYAASHFDETIDEVIRRMMEANIPASEAHQRWMLEKILSLQGFDGKLEDKQLELSFEDFVKSWEVLNPEKTAVENELQIRYKQFVNPLSVK